MGFGLAYIYFIQIDHLWLPIIWGLDKYESNNTCDGQTDRQTRTEVRTGKIYEFVQSNIMTPGVTKRWTLLTQVSRNV